jgi:hypothetical protein
LERGDADESSPSLTPFIKRQIMAKKKEFSILKWIIFPLNSVLLAGVIAWFNLRVFGWDDGLPYSLIVALIGIFSIIINKYTESENRTLARATFVFEIILTAALIGNAAWSLSVQREMSVARMGEASQKETITEIGKLRGGRTQREALKKIDKQQSASSVFARYESVLFWIMVGELGLYGLSAFTLFALAKLMDDPAPVEKPADFANRSPESDFPEELDVVDYTPPRKNAAMRQERGNSGHFEAVATVARDDSLTILRGHLKAIAFQHPGRWFKADLIKGGVSIRMTERQGGREVDIAKTRQSNKILAAVNRPDFRERLIAELVACGFPIGGER